MVGIQTKFLWTKIQFLWKVWSSKIHIFDWTDVWFVWTVWANAFWRIGPRLDYFGTSVTRLSYFWKVYKSSRIYWKFGLLGQFWKHRLKVKTDVATFYATLEKCYAFYYNIWSHWWTPSVQSVQTNKWFWLFRKFWAYFSNEFCCHSKKILVLSFWDSMFYSVQSLFLLTF